MQQVLGNGQKFGDEEQEAGLEELESAHVAKPLDESLDIAHQSQRPTAE